MKFNITAKWKVWIIITLVILIVGMALLGVLGLNKSLATADGEEINVVIDQDINNSFDTALNTANDYLEKNLSSSKTAFVRNENGFTFKYDKIEWKSGANADGLKTAIVNAINNANVEVGVEQDTSVLLKDMKIGVFAIALAVSLVIGFVFAIFTEKVVSAFTGALVALLGTILSVSLFAITRVPVTEYFLIFIAIAFILSFVLSIGMVDRFNEIAKKDGTLSPFDIANNGTAKSILRFAFVLVALIIAGWTFVILGASELLYIGLSIFVSLVSAGYSAFLFTPVIWANIKNAKN